MDTTTRRIGIIALVAVLIIVIFAIVRYNHAGKSSGSPVVSSSEQTAVTAIVEGFGQKLKMVSLLAPTQTVKESMDAQYSPYVAPELLALWEANPAQAPGRQVSSPWPDRIEVSSASKNADGSYTVTGIVIEVASAESSSGGAAATYPVTITLENRNGAWFITQFEKGPYDDAPESFSVNGEYVCLPHKDTSGPQTLECALGIKADSGIYYALDTSMESGGAFPNIATGQRIMATGTLVPIETLNTDQWQKYNVAGIIRASKLIAI